MNEAFMIVERSANIRN